MKLRLVPQSLFGRLALVMLAGLVLAQLAGTAIQFRDRGQRLFHASGLHSAARIAEIVRLLDVADAAERRRLVAILDVPPMRVSLTAPAWPAAEAMAEEGWPAAAFRARLERQLGGRHQVRVAVSDRPPAHPHRAGEGPMHDGRMGGHAGMGHMMGMGFTPPEALAFLAQVRLSDGAWVSFENRVPKEVFAGASDLFLSLAVLLVAVVVLSLFAVRWVTRPLALLAAAADKLGRNINQPALPETGPVELRHAARAFNTMQARLKRYIEERTRMLSAVSHDLRTPITRMRLRAELLEDEELRDSFVRNLDEMQAMTAEALDFLRGMDSEEPVRPVDVRALLESLAADAREPGGAVEIDVGELAPYPARPLALKRCIANLLENALKYGGRARLRGEEVPGALRITVSDQGPGIPEAELERVFEPFYRLESSRSRDTGGAGLGLSIARHIALAHGGTLQLRNRPEGGLEAVLSLPR